MEKAIEEIRQRYEHGKEHYLHHLKASRQLLRTINDEMIKGE